MEKKRNTGVVITITVILTAALTFMATSSFYALVLKAKATASFPGSERIFEVLSLLDSQYYYEVDRERLIDAALDNMLNSLGDPYTTYMDSEEYGDFLSAVTGTYHGIGTVVLWDDELKAVLIAKPFPDSPAEKAGIARGDKVIKINGETLENTDLDGAVAKIRGEIGTVVDLTILKVDSGETVEISVERDEVHIPSVEYEMMDDIGYISIASFDPQTGDDFKEAIKFIKENGAKALVIDVRDNGGGLVTTVTEVANSLLEPGSMIFYTMDKNGKKVEHKSYGAGIGLPMAVLINENSASASELLAGAIKDNTDAVLIGKNSFGKGVVQGTYPLSGGSVAKLTVEKYFTPGGSDINEKGLVPDVEVELTSTEDEQLQRALEILKEKIN